MSSSEVAYDSPVALYDGTTIPYGRPAAVQFFIEVEVGFTDTPASDLSAVSWTSITGYVRLSDGISLNRGRQDETSQVGGGTLALSVNNRDGRFTPENTAGAYFPNVKLRRPIRVTVYYDRSTLSVWTGYIDSWGEGWNRGVQSIARIRASDLMARLASLPMRSLAIEEGAYDGPVLLYPLNDSAGSTSAGDQSDTPHETLAVAQVGSGGTLTFGDAGDLGADTEQPVAVFTRVDATNGKYLQRAYASLPDLTAVSSASLACMVYIPVAVAGVTRVAELAGASHLIAIDLDANAPKMTVTIGSTVTATSGTAINDGAWHHVAVVYNGATAKLYVDGVERGSASAVLGAFTATTLTVGATAAGGSLFNGWLANVAAYGTAPPTTRLTAQAATVTGATGETSLQRFNRIVRLSVGSWAASTSASTPAATMSAQPFDGHSAAGLLYQVQDAELAPVYIAPSGYPMWQARTDRQPTLDPFSLDATLVDSSTGFTTSDQLVVNALTYSRPAGATVSVSDPTSVAEYGRLSDSRTVYFDSDAQLATAASFIINSRSSPRVRAGALSVDLTTIERSVDIGDLLALDVGGVLRVDNVPRGTGSIVDVFIEGVNDVITEQAWRRTWNTSPLQIGGAVWILGSSTFSVLGSTTTLAIG